MQVPALARAAPSFLSAVALCGLAAPGCVVAGGGSGSFDHRAEREETPALELASGRTLTLDAPSGDIRVSASSDGRSELRARIRSAGRSQEEAQAVLARYRVEVVNDASGARVRLVGDPLALSEGSMQLRISAEVDFVANVPAGILLEARTAAGDIEARGPFGGCRLETEHGNIEVEDVRGDLDARTSSGDVRARRAEGDTLSLRSQHGDVRLEHATAQRIACETESGDIDVEETRAPAVELSTSHGSVHVRGLAGDLRARSASGDVRAAGLEGAVDAASSYGTLEIEGVLTALRAATASGDVRVRALPESRADPSWSLLSSYGDVLLWLPDDFDCELDARTSHGSVESDFPILGEAGEPQDDSSLQGKLGAGGATVTLRATSGRVALKKL